MMPGFVDNHYTWMRHCAVFVLTSAWEGLPTLLIEAMACGAPVVSTDCPSGPAEILEGGKWGRLVPVGDVEAIKNGITNATLKEMPPGSVQRGMCFDINKASKEYIKMLETRHA
jgi:glycosyltransferase involved in cell wall biosynthesis